MKSRRPCGVETTERIGGGRGGGEEEEEEVGAADVEGEADGVVEEDVARPARESSESKNGLFHRGSSATEVDEEAEPEPEPEGEASAERWRRSLRLPQAAAATASDSRIAESRIAWAAAAATAAEDARPPPAVLSWRSIAGCVFCARLLDRWSKGQGR